MAARRKPAATRDTTRDDWLAALPDRYTDCRDIGHAWRPHAGGWDTESRSWQRVLRCPRCRVERTQVLDAYGDVVSNRYAYPDGYLAPAGSEPLSRSTFRLAAVTRTYGK